jgi:hypothetical protein
MFFQLPEAGPIDAIYSQFHDIDLMAQNEWATGFEANQRAMIALAEFDKYVRLGKLNMKILKKVCHQQFYEFFRKVRTGELQSHEKDLDPIP